MGKDKKDRKKFNETKVGMFLKEKAPQILNTIGNILPDNGAFGIVKNLITSDDKITPADKEYALKLIEMDMREMEEITKRWEADTKSGSWLARNVRPIVVLYSWILLTIVFCLKWAAYDLPDGYVSLFTTLALAVNAAYFGARTVEKYHKVKHK